MNAPLHLEMPKNSPQSNDIEDISATYLRAVASIPEALLEINNSLCDMADCLEALRLYAFRKGTDESIFKPDDIEIMEGGSEPKGD